MMKEWMTMTLGYNNIAHTTLFLERVRSWLQVCEKGWETKDADTDWRRTFTLNLIFFCFLVEGSLPTTWHSLAAHVTPSFFDCPWLRDWLLLLWVSVIPQRPCILPVFLPAVKLESCLHPRITVFLFTQLEHDGAVKYQYATWINNYKTIISKGGDLSRVWSEGSLFNSYYTKM